MATTHTRIQYALRLVVGHSTWDSRSEIVHAIRRAKPMEMKIRGDGSAIEHYMSPQSIGNLLTLMSNLGLIVIQSDGTVSADQEAANAVKNREVFDLLIQASVKSMLEQGGAPIEDVQKTIRTIRLPLVPDSKTIHAKLKTKHKSSPMINLDKFSQLLYLYACAGGLQRNIRVHYTSLEG
ncbi:hypothetical protein [Streptomyces stelliscabiei]|uniref:hypothetical protein n=1 Tax=Streptomyces stelliscabiei TaxID=146820 RepID=UPI0029A4877E|nr:hypothetical protein [Streptomyces stelliscabiei]MDX2554735.1 hypothetical protein [Streptomyces stelliscabiei]MDX2613262.1 hypothetical protein [Streptomyces stelliscabiei]MDX2638462.1 hypothetical protein [Streptomyces stelliscabiei]MDX2661614.1 hypothetical protein [Streptomyces stelliscabiei]MDX2712253.1 hypothetical protein [Streptomyces stelliscabiei]